jgi:NAD-dependent dihydropyrimidine dehydrogenase PreA subunit
METTLDKKFATWKNIPREEIHWHPVIDTDKCTGCGMCVTSCGRNVFDFNPQTNKALVARPLNCMVGCTSCECWCVFNAIRFPERQYVRDLIKKKHVLSLVKKQLAKRLTTN